MFITEDSIDSDQHSSVISVMKKESKKPITAPLYQTHHNKEPRMCGLNNRNSPPPGSGGQKSKSQHQQVWFPLSLSPWLAGGSPSVSSVRSSLCCPSVVFLTACALISFS